MIEILGNGATFDRPVSLAPGPQLLIMIGGVARQGWKGIFSHDGGWLAAGKAINAIGEVLRERGVNFGFGG